MKALNICIISQEFPPYTNWGGIAVYYSELAKMYRHLGHTVTIVSRAESGAPELQRLASGVVVWRVGQTLQRKYYIGRTFDRMLHAFDVERKVKELDGKNPFDIIEATESGLDVIRLLKNASLRSRTIIQCHGSNAHGVKPKGPFALLHRLDWKLSFFYEKRLLMDVPCVLVASESDRQFLIGIGIDVLKIHLVYHGIDTQRYRPISQRSSGLLEVGFAGRLEKRKGIDYVWKIMETVGPNAGIRFHFKGALHPSMQDEINNAKKKFASYSIFHAVSKPEEMPNYYNSLDVLLQPSRYEAFGLVYVEAMACGLVVFAGKNGGGAEIVEHGQTGFLVDPDGSPEVVAATLKEIASNPSAFSYLGHRARQAVVERFSLEACALLKLEYYRVLNADKISPFETP